METSNIGPSMENLNADFFSIFKTIKSFVLIS